MNDDGEHEQGFTLLEVMLTVVLLSIVMGALATAAIVFLRNMNETQSRLYVSNSRSLTSRYLVGDIQAAAVYDAGYTAAPWDGATGGTVVVPASTPLPATPVVVATPAPITCASPQPVVTTYHYDVFPPGPSGTPASKDRPTRVEYTVEPAPGDDCQLVRSKSTVSDVGGAYDWTSVERNVVAHDLLVDGTNPMVTVTSDPPGDPGALRWQVKVRLKPKTSEDVTYDYDLWAKRRVDTIVP